MRRCSLLALLSITLLGTLLATTGAKGEVPAAKNGDEDRLVVTRSDGSVVKMRRSDQKEIQKIVGHIQDGMNHADRADKLEQRKRVSRSGRAIIRHRER
jgi:uncharacterized protein (DUF305 family)